MTSAVEEQRAMNERSRRMRLAAQAYAHGYSVAVQAEAAGVPVEEVTLWQRREPMFWHEVEHEKALIALAKAEDETEDE